MKAILLFLALTFCANSYANLIINKDSTSGLITGLSNVEINSKLYSANFESGSFNTVYAGSLDNILDDVSGNELVFTQALVAIFNSVLFNPYKGKPFSFEGCTSTYFL